MPYVKTVSSDKRVANRDEGETIPVSNFAQVESALRALDGKIRTQVILEGDGKALMIGGGNDGGYNLLVAVEVDQQFFNLVNPQGHVGERNRLVIGGQEGIYTGRQVVNLDTVLQAASTFFESGECADNLAWEGQ